MYPRKYRLSQKKSEQNQSKADKRRTFAEEEGWMMYLTPSSYSLPDLSSKPRKRNNVASNNVTPIRFPIFTRKPDNPF